MQTPHGSERHGTQKNTGPAVELAADLMLVCDVVDEVVGREGGLEAGAVGVREQTVECILAWVAMWKSG